MNKIVLTNFCVSCQTKRLISNCCFEAISPTISAMQSTLCSYIRVFAEKNKPTSKCSRRNKNLKKIDLWEKNSDAKYQWESPTELPSFRATFYILHTYSVLNIFAIPSDNDSKTLNETAIFWFNFVFTII